MNRNNGLCFWRNSLFNSLGIHAKSLFIYIYKNWLQMK